jgi:ABC-type nitrate/sulfonate/bicarbonate transport system permease component
MRTTWLRKAHLYLGVFFSPLLLFFILTGCWQTLGGDQDADAKSSSLLRNLMSRLSTVHTDDYYPHGAAEHHSHVAMKALVLAMAVALVLSIVLGLVLAWVSPKGKWLATLMFLLGIVAPVVILWLA